MAQIMGLGYMGMLDGDVTTQAMKTAHVERK